MSRMVIWETGYLGACFMLGLCLMLLYDILRVTRIVLPHRGFFVGVEDMLYWLAVSAASFHMLYRGNDGIIRWYAVAAIALGMVLFNICISRYTVPFIGKILRLPIDFIGKVLKRWMKTVTIRFKKVRTRWFHGREKVEKKEKQ